MFWLQLPRGRPGKGDRRDLLSLHSEVDYVLPTDPEALMTAPYARQPEVLPRPAWTPTAIRAVLAACADGDIL
jgi:hypothetical protein